LLFKGKMPSNYVQSIYEHGCFENKNVNKITWHCCNHCTVFYLPR